MLDRLPDLEFAVGRIEEVIDVLHVDLHEGNTHAPLLLALGLVEVAKDVVKAEWNESLVLAFYGLQGPHCVCLACPRLPIHKQTCVIAL